MLQKYIVTIVTWAGNLVGLTGTASKMMETK